MEEKDRIKRGCLGKEGYRSMLAAEYILENWNEVRSKKMGRNTVLLEIYKCEFCGLLHIGHNNRLDISKKIK